MLSAPVPCSSTLAATVPSSGLRHSHQCSWPGLRAVPQPAHVRARCVLEPAYRRPECPRPMTVASPRRSVVTPTIARSSVLYPRRSAKRARYSLEGTMYSTARPAARARPSSQSRTDETVQPTAVATCSRLRPARSRALRRVSACVLGEAPPAMSMAFPTSSDLGNPLPKMWTMQSRISSPASSSAVAVQWEVRGSAHTRAWPPGLSTRRTSHMTSVSQPTHRRRPPLSASHDLPMNEIPAGGSVTTASTLASGISFSTSRQSPTCRATLGMLQDGSRIRGSPLRGRAGRRSLPGRPRPRRRRRRGSPLLRRGSGS